MWLLRVLGFLLLIAIGASVVAFLITRNRAYLRVAWQVFKYGLLLALILLAFLALERIIAGVL